MDGKTPVNQSSPPRTQVKKENEEEIKEFAETAMNELLGWYGYERLELRRWAASRARDGSSPEQASEQKNKDECSWCNKSIASESGALQHAGATFCSELCFSQSRRANFKRAKTCDWCRHVRHTVAYVDFQDGATQLQFCSDKCLNQYKMHIFCRETQAHLEQHPHLAAASSSAALITPDLWLRNCRSASPRSETSASPDKNNDKSDTKTQSPLPLITVAPTAKLMKQKKTDEQKSPEAKKDIRNKMNLRKRRTSKSAATQPRQRTSTPKAQDLRMCSPESSPSANIQSPPNTINQHPPPPPFNPMYNMPPPMFMDNPHMNDVRPPMFPPRMPFMPRPGMPMHERPCVPPQVPNFPPPLGQAPPVTVLVPYPVILPLPIPIPIPIPFSSFVQAHATKVKTESNNEETEGPLDFTMSSKRDDTSEETAPQNVTEEISTENTEPDPSDSNERIEVNEEVPETNPEQTLPKFKITRLGNKMAKIVTKPKEPSESTRPLRKRRRLVEVANEDDALIPKTRKIVEV